MKTKSKSGDRRKRKAPAISSGSSSEGAEDREGTEEREEPPRSRSREESPAKSPAKMIKGDEKGERSAATIDPIVEPNLEPSDHSAGEGETLKMTFKITDPGITTTAEGSGKQIRDVNYKTQTSTEKFEAAYAKEKEKGMSKAPHFPQQPVARQNEDGSLELECYVDANPKPEIKWFYDNKEVKPDSRFSLKLDNRGSDQFSAILTIKDLADSDAGAYRCALVNPHGKGNANFNLKLTGFSSPTFVEKPQISSRDDGQVMVMEFRAKSILKPVFVWSKGEEIVSPSDRVHVVLREEPNQIYYAALEIKDPTKEKDAGQFVCTAKNDSGKLTATFTVKFEVPQGAPTFTRKPQILQKTSDSGDPAIVFDIGYQADRNPEVIWINPKGKKMKESSRIKFASSSDSASNNTYTANLELKNYKAKDSGTYTCNIKNEAGEANVELTLNIEGPMDDGGDDNSDA